MKKNMISKTILIKVILLLLVFTNFSISFAYWASHVAVDPFSSDSSLHIGEWGFINAETKLAIATFRSNHENALALTTENVQVSDKVYREQALAAYGLLTESAKTVLIDERDVLLSLLTEIVAFENSEFLDFEGFFYDEGLTGTVVMNDRTWFGNTVYISNNPTYDEWSDTRSLALKTGSHFESRDFFINGIDKITLYHGALNYNNEASFQFGVEYELQTNPGVWIILQEGGSNLLIDVISGNPLSYSEINVNITEAINIRFTPVISNTTDYINLDDIKIYKHIVSESIEVDFNRITLTEDLDVKSGYHSYLAQFHIADGYTLIDYGMLTSLKDKLIINFDTSNILINQGSNFFMETNEFVMSFTNSSHYIARAYLIVKDDYGILHIFYSDLNPRYIRPVELGLAGDFVVLTQTGITATVGTLIKGNIGVSPIVAASMTGFGLALDPSGTFATSTLVVGMIYAADYASPTASYLTNAVIDMRTAYLDASERTPDFVNLGAGDISGLTLVPGVYFWSTGLLINSTVTLSGNASDLWIFQISGTLTQAASIHIILSGGAVVQNVVWQVAGAIVLGANAHFEGTILGMVSVAFGADVTLNGRILTQTALTLISGQIN